MNKPTVTVLICTLNEESNLSHVLPGIPDWVDEVLIVDGHSTDNTIQLAKELLPRARILYQSGKGKGDALKLGIQEATGDIIVTLDADGSTDPMDISRFVEPLTQGYDFAKGSRFLANSPRMAWHRRLGNWVLTTTTNVLFGTKYTDICSGYNAFWKKAFERVKLKNDGFEMEQEMNVRIIKAGLKVIEIPCQDRGRYSGISKTQDIKQGLKDLMTVVKERFRN